MSLDFGAGWNYRGAGGRSNVLAFAGGEMMLSRDHGRDARERLGMAVPVMVVVSIAESKTKANLSAWFSMDSRLTI